MNAQTFTFVFELRSQQQHKVQQKKKYSVFILCSGKVIRHNRLANNNTTPVELNMHPKTYSNDKNQRPFLGIAIVSLLWIHIWTMHIERLDLHFSIEFQVYFQLKRLFKPHIHSVYISYDFAANAKKCISRWNCLCWPPKL